MAAPAPSAAVAEATARCRRYTRRRASNFYYAFRALPRAKRDAIYAAYAFAGTVDDIVDAAAGDAAAGDAAAGDAADNPARQRAALDRARAGLTAAYAGEPQDWLYLALAAAVRRYAIPRAYFDDLLDGMAQDLDQRRYATFADLEGYCYRAASVIGLICIEIFEYDPARREEAVRAAIDLGKALQLTNILRDLREDVERNRIYLAQEDLQRFGYTEDDLRRGVRNAAFRALMAEYVRRARVWYDSGDRLIPLLAGARSRMCCLGLGGVYRAILDAIEAQDYDVFTERVSPSRPQRLWLLLRLWARGALPSGHAPARRNGP